jgi:hypothetical protein
VTSPLVTLRLPARGKSVIDEAPLDRSVRPITSHFGNTVPHS